MISKPANAEFQRPLTLGQEYKFILVAGNPDIFE